jgi:endoglucanase
MRLPQTLAFGALVGCVLAVSLADSGCLSTPSLAANDAVVPPKGCLVEGGAPPPAAPNGYYTNGGTVCTADGTPHAFHGVDRPSLEWGAGGDRFSLADFQLMVEWGANVVRIALNQDFWLSGAALSDPRYPGTVQERVSWAEQAGLDVILDLHWSDTGVLGAVFKDMMGKCLAGDGTPTACTGQQPMADQNSIEFWKEVATAYKDDGRVLFELYNEPHGISWDVWLNGGNAGSYTAVGMQRLYDTVRGAGANNVVIAGGLNWAYDLSGVGPTGAFVRGYNVMYATHPYLTSGNVPSGWEGSFGHLETTDFAPVIATEFGDGSTPNCAGNWDGALIAFANQHHMSWTAWAWFLASSSADPQGCHFPSLILDWSGTPSVQGAVVQAALGAYPKSMPTAGADAGVQEADGQADAGSEAPDDASDAGAPGLSDALSE